MRRVAFGMLLLGSTNMGLSMRARLCAPGVRVVDGQIGTGPVRTASCLSFMYPSTSLPIHAAERTSP